MRELRLLAAGFVLAAAATSGAETVPADTLVVDLPELMVISAKGAHQRTDRTRLTTPILAVTDPRSLADLAVQLPSARIAVNSRGDAHAMVRGAPERHVQTYLDGIPLNLPWDERVDLETIPAVGVGAVEGRRGPATLLDGPGALAGSVRLLPPTAPDGARASRLAMGMGTRGTARADLLHQQRAGDWQLMGAGAWHKRDAWSQPGNGARTNSDLEQWSLLLRGARPVGTAGRLSLLATAWTAEKGVPPELHLPDEDLRHWRYPVRERGLLGAVLDLPLGAHSEWDLGAAVSADWHRQEVDPRGPDRWGAPLEVGEDYEKSWDRTGFGRLRLTRWVGDSMSLAAQASARYTHHRETVVVGDPIAAYSQWLTSLAVEGEWAPIPDWTLRTGLGQDHATTPETGGKPDQDAVSAVALNLRLTHEIDRRTTVYGAASRRSRFPSLRESFSGALGKFEPNPDLAPERQDQFEVGAMRRGDGWRVEAAAFHGRLDDGIEKVALEGGRFQRVNRTRISVPGLEFIGSWEFARDVDLRLQHTILAARVEGDIADSPAEDRPDHQSLASMTWRPSDGPGARIEARATGPRWSADGTSPDGLTRLPAGVTWHLRLGWRWAAVPGTTTDIEAYLRLDNVFDERVDGQVGLPAPGRTVSGGVSLSL